MHTTPFSHRPNTVANLWGREYMFPALKSILEHTICPVNTSRYKLTENARTRCSCAHAIGVTSSHHRRFADRAKSTNTMHAFYFAYTYLYIC